MPDDSDYNALRELLERPATWTDEDASLVKAMIVNQRRAIAELHINDVRGRRVADAVVRELELALEQYMARRVNRS